MLPWVTIPQKNVLMSHLYIYMHNANVYQNYTLNVLQIVLYLNKKKNWSMV